MRNLVLALVINGSISFLSAQNWSAWKPDSIYGGIEIRERCAGFNEFANGSVWDVQLRNTYHKNVDLSWAAEPDLLRGVKAQSERALTVKPGEVVDAHHTAHRDCSAGLLVKVNDVRASGAGTAPSSGSAAFRPKIQGRWQSKDPEPLRKELTVTLSGKTVTSSYSSPNFSLQVSTPLPEGVSGSVSIEHGDQK